MKREDAKGIFGYSIYCFKHKCSENTYTILGGQRDKHIFVRLITDLAQLLLPARGEYKWFHLLVHETPAKC